MPVTFDRFLRVVSGGVYNSQALFDVRRDKVNEALDEIDNLLAPFPQGTYPELDQLRLEVQDYRQRVQTGVNLAPNDLRKATEMLDPLKDQARSTKERALKVTARVKELRKTDLHYQSQEYQDDEQHHSTTKPFDDWDKAFNQATQALTEMPSASGAVFDLIGVLGAYITQLPLIQARVQAIGTDQHAPQTTQDRYENYKDSLRECNELVQALTNRRIFLQGMLDKMPTTERQIYHGKAESVRAAIRQLDKLIQANPLVLVLPTARANLDTRRQQLVAHNSTKPVKNLEKVLGKKGGSPSRYKQMITAGGAAAILNMPLITPDAQEDAIMSVILEWCARQINPGLSESDAKKLVKHQYHEAQVEELNQGKNWTTIDKPVELVGKNGKPIKVQSKIIPQSQLGNKFTGMNNKGVCSHDTKQYKTTVNLAGTEVTNEDGEVLFKGLRHGINCAYGLQRDDVKAMPDDEMETMLNELCKDERTEDVKRRAGLRRQIEQNPQASAAVLLDLQNQGISPVNGIDAAVLKEFDLTPLQVTQMAPQQRVALLRRLLAHRRDPEAEKRIALKARLEAAKLQNDGGVAKRALLQQMRDDGEVAGVSVEVLRRKANDNRSMDIVVAALVRNPDKLRAALAQPNKAVNINLSSLSLVTPDSYRGGEGDEKTMLREQMEAWERLSANPQPRKVWVQDGNGDDVQVTVRIDVLAFNFGVNQGAVTGIGNLPGVSGWWTSDGYNGKAMDRLLGKKDERKRAPAGRVGEWMHEQDEILKGARKRIESGQEALKRLQKVFDDTDPLDGQYAARKLAVDDLKKQLKQQIEDFEKRRKNRIIVEKLARQIAAMWDSSAYKSEGTEPYKMPARLAVLTFKMGDDPAFNCKSGKDRTGQLDAEAKLLATQIDQDGDVAEPDHQLSEVEKRNRWTMALNSGNHEMQQYNTGHMGYKLEGVDALDESYPDEEGLKEFRGSSNYTKA